jgi:SAM-dependent methyltransferase
MFAIILNEAKKLIRSPKRLLQIFYPRRWRQFFGILFFSARTGDRWKPVEGENQFKKREYISYGQYLRHQQAKSQYLDLTDYDINYRRQLKERLRDLPFMKRGGSVLCLGARQGTEVKAFHDMGCFAVGIDLNPGKENQFVVHGDFHHLQFPAESADIVFTNSFDHAFDAKKLIAEITRVLKRDGVLVIEAIHGDEEKTSPDYYASFWWKRVDDLVALLAQHGCQLIHRGAFVEPWSGDQICFRKSVKP